MVVLASTLLTKQTTGKLRGVLVMGLLLIALTFAFGDTVALVLSEGYETYVQVRDPTPVARTAMYIASYRIAVDHFPWAWGSGSSEVTSPNCSTVRSIRPMACRTFGDCRQATIASCSMRSGRTSWGGSAFSDSSVSLSFSRLLVAAGSGPSGIADLLVKALTAGAVLTFIEALVESTAATTFESTLSSFFLFGMAAVERTTGLHATRPVA